VFKDNVRLAGHIAPRGNISFLNKWRTYRGDTKYTLHIGPPELIGRMSNLPFGAELDNFYRLLNDARIYGAKIEGPAYANDADIDDFENMGWEALNDVDGPAMGEDESDDEFQGELPDSDYFEDTSKAMDAAQAVIAKRDEASVASLLGVHDASAERRWMIVNIDTHYLYRRQLSSQLAISQEWTNNSRLSKTKSSRLLRW
jgi:hypothetical protein